MKKLILISLPIFLITIYCFADKDGKGIKEPASQKTLFINGKLSHLVLKTSNGCGIGNFLIPSTGDSSQQSPPLLGLLTGFWSNYTYSVVDTIPGKQIKGVAFTRTSWWAANTSIITANTPAEPYVVVSDTGIFTYWFDGNLGPDQGNIYELDSTFIPGILKMATQVTTDKTNPIVLLVEDTISNYRVRIFSYPGLADQFSFPFYFEPEIFEVIDSSLFISGWDTNGTYMLYHFSAFQDTLYATYALNYFSSNAHEILKTGDSLFVLSSPGDSITVLTHLSMTTGTLLQNVIYQSGARATYNEYQNNKFFTFQPTDTVLNKMIMVFDPATGVFSDTLMINRNLDWFKHPDPAYAGFGYFSMEWMGARWENGLNDSVFVSEGFGANLINIEAGAFPQYINATYGCWVGVHENELEEINFEVHPNPASSETVISLTGLTKSRQYILTITDITGKIQYTTTLEAYQEINLPINILTDGMYLLNLNTGKNIITRKLIIEY